MPDDLDAPTAIAAVLGTFDGAGEPDDTLQNMIIGGIAGAIAGILVALSRRRRLKMAQIGVDEPPPATSGRGG